MSSNKRSHKSSNTFKCLIPQSEANALLRTYMQMHGLTVCFSSGATAIVCYLWGRRIKGKADFFNSITRVIDLKGLDDFLKEKSMNLLVVVSGKVASATPFKCKDNGSLDFVFEHKAVMDYETKLVDGSKNKSLKFLLQENQTPWYLEDNTVVGAEDAVRFWDILKEDVDIPKTKISEIFSPKEGSKVLYRSALNIGTYLSFVGECVRDKAGNLMIQKPRKEQPFMVFSGEGSFDKMVGKLKSNSEFYIFYSKIFGTIALAIAVMYGVDFIRRWKKKNFGNNR